MRSSRICGVFVVMFLAMSCASDVTSKSDSEDAVTTTKASTTTAANASTGAAPEPSLISFFSGTLLDTPPEEVKGGGSASVQAVNMFDDRPTSFWRTPDGVVDSQSFVVEMPQPATISALGFDNKSGAVDGTTRSAAAKDISVEMSDESPTSGFAPVAEVTLAPEANDQRFELEAPRTGRWLRFNVKNNHGSAKYMSLAEVRAYGEAIGEPETIDVSGSYDTTNGDLHLRQEGNTVTGCHTWSGEGTISGGIEGRVAKLNWTASGGRASGSAAMIFSGDGNKMRGLYFFKGTDNIGGNVWNGEKVSDEVGSCNGKPIAAKDRFEQSLDQDKRLILYGVNFATDSDTIDPASTSTLDQLAATLETHPDWTVAIEGHTDSTGSASHNQDLSGRRAESVKAYLVGAGITAAQLSTVGYGAERPVASNDTPLGQAQNRRVEVVRQ